jgi:uncharacterized membrane protein
MLPTRKQLHHHVYHHSRFYVALASGVFVWAAFVLGNGPQPVAAAGDAFFVVYLAAALGVLVGHTPADLKRRAARQDEGILVVVAITLTVIAVNVTGVFLALNAGGKLDSLSLALVLAAAPLGWFVLHTISAFHYANMFYFDPPGDAKAGEALEFPGTPEPDLWDFLYFSFVIGMTAQVSDVQVRSGAMRKAATGHGIVAFFFNTVLIALVVNAVVAR